MFTWHLLNDALLVSDKISDLWRNNDSCHGSYEWQWIRKCGWYLVICKSKWVNH